MTKIRLYNSMTRRKAEFKPIDPSRITMYVCGPTVYDTPHLGNARPAVIFDVLYRFLQHQYGYDSVVYARNITDVDDKIAAKSVETGRSVGEITSETIDWYHDDMEALNVKVPTVEPRVTDTLIEIDQFAGLLIEKDHAYRTASGDVYFDLSSFPEHGKLSRHNREDLNVGENQSSEKKHPQDFALWKENHQRPGWHIECSAMIKKHLGLTIDIHGGGADLRFPHHENEIAQSEAANGVPLANIWMHNGMITVNGKKMSKSLGNFITVREALEKYPGESIRFFMLKTHYRQPMDWTWEGLETAHKELNSLYRKAQVLANDSQTRLISYDPIVEILADDLNTPKLISYLHESGDPFVVGRFLGLFQHRMDDWFKLGVNKDSTFIEDLVKQRDEARAKKDWKRSDQLRDRLHSMDVELEDSPDGTIWRRK